MILDKTAVQCNHLCKWVAEYPQKYSTGYYFRANTLAKSQSIQSQEFNTTNGNFNHQRAEGILPILEVLLGITLS
ncbi:hypothetical protein QM480_24130 [Flectobacillus sp. DC10W]|jgi:hypothetical protein|uniref:Transposase n=1 Tax=Flectobacillus longus TaxID=2984207 RepID=A0ABT6YV12_9BACT|nr:hypothetical protein [Flectobacillus longus]MDI9867454.1 hypothetical protein [Flectobacillus longus]